MSSTNLALPYLADGQAQKHITVNESLRRLDALVQLAVVSATTSAQPGSPADGQVYIMPAGKTGAAWGAMTNNALAYYRDGAWEEITPREGFRAYVKDTDKLLIWDGGAWAQVRSANGFPSGGAAKAFPYKNSTTDFDVAFSAKVWLDESNGRVGIGTSAPGELLDIVGDGVSTNFRLTRYGGNPGATWRAAGGSLAAPSQVLAGGLLGGFVSAGWHSGGAFSNNVVGMFFKCAENFTSTAQGAYITLETTPNGSTTRTERVRVDQDGAITVRANAQVLVDANGLVGLRSYTVATLPSASVAARMIYVSNEVGGAVLAFSDGTNWRRVTDRAVVS